MGFAFNPHDPNPDPFNLERFVTAQNKDNSYNAALSEIRSGRKATHWIWYIFPQLKGLSTSIRGQRYGITGLAEAQAYLEHPVLRARLVEISRAVLQANQKRAWALMGSGIDEEKLWACMTLFQRADGPGEEVFKWSEVLKKYFKGEGHQTTEEMLFSEGADEAEAGGGAY
ncbi:uncharacterized protein L3040_004073 [Drepanopeziza brunnea f. sp. 'multigermtubi']|uniref:Calpastatin n=1 Tax=Marssonina brunnea f. sp. multigermtubi (strain MB_m1) TaxID=1072389 RepID=K1W6F5_MARBU|nr:uncharacterized protein MBM_09311 [Drepanopeziza brunnea f. sp. 'multigermtubi' MB_m1]EKD12555.1 hypothetical protein MBM_09311 [Drepanopeziza brunnea f. sp. 'multigermtubi' MB_m1]KAJ5042674.1 hypothetical protein L3040_004073 [Drepanopeziza brunnea f. sp. 'multigermtubi']